MRKFYTVFFAIVMVILCGCNTTPYDRATIYYDRSQFESQVAKDIPIVGEAVLQHGRCSVLISTPGSKTGEYNFCVFALTKSSLYVLGWNPTALKYVEIIRVDLSNVSKVALDSYFRTYQVQLIESRRLTALSVVIDEGGYNDTNSTVRIFETLKGHGIKVVKGDGMVMPPAPPVPLVIPVVIPR